MDMQKSVSLQKSIHTKNVDTVDQKIVSPLVLQWIPCDRVLWPLFAYDAIVSMKAREDKYIS